MEGRRIIKRWVMTTKAVATKVPWNQEQLGLITRTVAKGATKDELALFFNVAKRTGLDVFTKQIHFVKRKVWNKELGQTEEIGTIQTGIDGYRAIAERSGGLAGSEDAVFDTEEEDHPNKATVTVWRMVNGIRCSFTASARWDEYAAIHPKTKAVMGQWVKMPYLMLSKCAEALALRKAFPNDLSGIYTNEEMEQASMEAPIIEEGAKSEDKSAKKAEATKLMAKKPEGKVIDATSEISDEEMDLGERPE